MLGVPGEQAEREEVVRLAAVHRLGQFEHALRGFSLKAPETLGEEGLHPLGDVVLGEEFGGIDAVVDEIAQIEDRVAARGVERTGPGECMPA